MFQIKQTKKLGQQHIFRILSSLILKRFKLFKFLKRCYLTDKCMLRQSNIFI